MEPLTLAELERRLTDLAERFPESDASHLPTFLNLIAAWKDDNTPPRNLLKMLDRVLGHVWFSTTARHDAVFEALEGFRATVANIGGMTMNERVVMFDLLDRWDATSQASRLALYEKLEGSP